MSKKNRKDKKSRPMPKPNRQIPNSLIRPFTGFMQSPYLENPRKYPIFGCWLMEDWRETGLTPGIVARLQDNDHIMFAVTMIDYYCLGIKDAFTRVDYTRNRFERELPQLCMKAPIPCSVEVAHELIYGSLEYAKKLGFEPHPDFYKQKADQILDPEDAHPRTNGITFGRDGRPVFIPGPFDNEIKSRSIFNTLMRSCGPGNFDYMEVFDDLPEEIE